MTTRTAFPVMGTVCSIAVSSADESRLGGPHLATVLGSAAAELHRIEQRFSHYRADSDISRWSAGQEMTDEAQAEIEHVLAQCERLRSDSGGVFVARDPRTGALDTAGYVKGYAIGRAAATMRSGGLTGFVVGVGGDACCVGRAGQARPWRVAVQDPTRPGAVLALLEPGDGAVATSGRAQRGDHIWRGTGAAASPLRSFTVVGPDIAEADAYATIGFALGEDGIDWVRGHDGYASLVVLADGSLAGDAVLAA